MTTSRTSPAKKNFYLFNAPFPISIHTIECCPTFSTQRQSANPYLEAFAYHCQGSQRSPARVVLDAHGRRMKKPFRNCLGS